MRDLQSRYVGLWCTELQRRSPALPRRAAQATVHATFGLINSTPFSARLPRAAMLELLDAMAEGALHAGLGSSQALAERA